MRYQVLYDNFIQAVKDKIPPNAKIAAVLADILLIEKEAVYRRLRMDVPFTFSEIAAIAQELGLSLDNIVESNATKSRPLQLKLVDYIEPLEIDYTMLDYIIYLLEKTKNLTGTEIGISSNIIPQHFYYHFDNLTRFFLFKWNYMYGSIGSARSFGQIDTPQRLRAIQLKTAELCRHFKITNYLLDNLIIEYLVNDIKYFESIHMLTPHEVELLKQDIFSMLGYIENLSYKGYFEDTRNKVNIYISNINFETSYVYAETPTTKFSMIKAFTLNAVATQDQKTFDTVRTWMNSLKRVSTLISESGEQQRIQFFESSRKTVDTL